MVYGFVKQSGGHLEIASEPGRGTAVKLYLPASAPDRVSAPVETPAAGRHDEHVLVVEDDATVRRLQVRSLRALGYHALEAADGPAALALIEAHPEIDLLLTDVVLPAELTGPALAQAALARRPALKIVFMSGYAAAVAATGDDLPERPILSKPFTRSMLAAALDQQFGRGDPA
jgi:CheY-like chemotaxis protein